ncbi:MAG: type II toxin-antitoxin system RelE/ParE family toxin [Patescibacteria group bacterium]
MNYLFRPSAEKQFAKLNSQTQSTIAKKLSFFASMPNPLSYAKRLKHFESGQYRFRIGDWRVAFDVQEQTIVILAIGHRSEIYRE